MLPLIILLLLLLFETINGAVTVKNKNDFLNNVNKEEEFNLGSYTVIDSSTEINVTSNTFKLTGTSKSAVILFNKNLVFQKSCTNIEFYNVVLYGNFIFNSNQKVKFNTVSFNGYFIANNKDENLNPTIEIKNSQFNLPKTNNPNELTGFNLNISQTSFFGNNLYNMYLIKFSGINKSHLYNFSIINSSISGNYHNSAIKSIYANQTIQSVTIEKCYSGKLLNG